MCHPTAGWVSCYCSREERNLVWLPQASGEFGISVLVPPPASSASTRPQCCRTWTRIVGMYWPEGQGHLMAQNQKVQPVPIAYIVASLIIYYGKRSLRKKKKNNPKLRRENKITWEPSFKAVQADPENIKPPKCRLSPKCPLLRQCPLATSFAELVILSTSQMWSSRPRERYLWIGHPLNTELKVLPKAVFKSCVFRTSSKPCWVSGPRSTRNYWIHA